MIDMVHRVVPNAQWLSQLSPVYYYNLSKTLIPGYGADARGMAVLVALTVALTAVAVRLFAKRDLGGVVAGPRLLRLPERAPKPAVLPVRDWSLSSIYARGLAMVAWPTFWWTLAIAGFAAWMVVVINQTAASMQSLMGSTLGQQLLKAGGSNVATTTSILSLMFIFLPLLLMAFAVTQANRWSADEEDGRLEIVLSTPQPRLVVLLGRFAALSTAVATISVVTLLATAGMAALAGIAIDGGKLIASTLTMIPLALLVAALGYLFSGWLRTSVDTGLLSFLLVIWFFISFVGPGLKLPDATLRLSALYYYGSPLLHGLELGNLLVVVGVGAFALALASFRFARKDIGI